MHVLLARLPLNVRLDHCLNPLLLASGSKQVQTSCTVFTERPTQSFVANLPNSVGELSMVTVLAGHP